MVGEVEALSWEQLSEAQYKGGGKKGRAADKVYSRGHTETYSTSIFKK